MAIIYADNSVHEMLITMPRVDALGLVTATISMLTAMNETLLILKNPVLGLYPPEEIPI